MPVGLTFDGRQDCITAGDPRARQMSCFPPRTLLRPGCRTMARTSGHRPQIYRKPRAELVPADNATSALLARQHRHPRPLIGPSRCCTERPPRGTPKFVHPWRVAPLRRYCRRSGLRRGEDSTMRPRRLSSEPWSTVPCPGVSAHERRRSSPHVGQRLEIDAGLGEVRVRILLISSSATGFEVRLRYGTRSCAHVEVCPGPDAVARFSRRTSARRRKRPCNPRSARCRAARSDSR